MLAVKLKTLHKLEWARMMQRPRGVAAKSRNGPAQSMVWKVHIDVQ